MNNLLLELHLKNFSDDPTQENFTRVLSIIGEYSLTQLSLYCLNPTIRSLLDLPAFAPFWQNKLDAFRIKSSPEFRFKKAENLSELEVTLGFFNFMQAMENPDKRENYLNISLSFRSFHALKKSVATLCGLIKQNQFDTAFEKLPLLIENAKWHGTPGYLLIANLYLHFATYLRSDAVRAEAAIKCVFTYLEMAKRAEPHSQSAIHNAYYGKGLVESSQFRLATIAEMQKACRGLLSRWVSEEMLSSSTSIAARLYSQNKPQRSTSSQTEFSEFHKAILADSPELIRAHFDKLQLEQKNGWGETPLLFAARHGKINSVRCLLSLGANPRASVSTKDNILSPTIEDQSYDALQIALSLGNKGICRVLLDHTAGANSQTDGLHAEQDDTDQQARLEQLFLTPDCKYSLEKIRELLDLGASPNLLLPSGKTALSHMLLAGNIAGVELLMNYGASVNQPDAGGETVLFCLLETNLTKKTRECLEVYFRRFAHLGANINAQNTKGETLLIKAVKNDDIETVHFLLQQKGIDINLVDDFGHDASFYASKNPWIFELIAAARQRNSMDHQTSAGPKYQSGKAPFFFSKEISSTTSGPGQSSREVPIFG